MPSERATRSAMAENASRPGRGLQLAVDAHVRPVEPLRAQAVDHVPRLVGNPLLVDRLVDARQDAHHLAAARVDADRRADRVHHVDRLRLAELPRPRRERIGFRGQRADRADVDEIALQLRAQRLLEVGRDLHVLAAAGRAHFRHAADFRREADAARALDAAVHRGLDQRAEILVLDRALVLGVAAGVDAVAHRLVLQVALAALVADRAVERMVDQQELHHAFARLLHHRRFGADGRQFAVRARTAVAHAPGAARHRLRRAFQLDQAHAAVAGDRQPLVVAEARNLGARRLARLQQRVFGRHIDFLAIDEKLGHGVYVFLSLQSGCDIDYSAASTTQARLRQSFASFRYDQPKRMIAVAMRLEMFEPLQRLLERGLVAGRHPPHRRSASRPSLRTTRAAARRSGDAGC